MNQEAKRGRLKIFLGYAAGVGKTYRMLVEGQALQREGVDVVIGYFEPHERKDTMTLAAAFEIVPRRVLEYRGVRFEEMDTEAILRRHPALCLVDEFAHTNVPGSARTKRWEDVQVLLTAGIDVFTTMNVQHLESLNDQVWQISGVRVRETVPDWVVAQADEVVMVDLTTRALLNRLQRGVIYEPAKARAALSNFFRESTLGALRELALRQTAHEVEARQKHGSEAAAVSGIVPNVTGARDRILIYISAEPSAAMVIRRGWRVANYLHAECHAVAVQPDGAAEGGRARAAERQAIERHLAFARSLRVETHTLVARDPARALVAFARQHQITQLFLARTRHRLFARDWAARVVSLAPDIQVTIMAERRR
ncbi:MAG TPA: histidine kinase [Terriglobales bacterium]|nr:histidine kinase [Terriglobales bacterium]